MYSTKSLTKSLEFELDFEFKATMNPATVYTVQTHALSIYTFLTFGVIYLHESRKEYQVYIPQPVSLI